MPRLVIHPAGGGGSGSSDCTGLKQYFLANHGTIISVDSGDVPVEGSLPENAVLQSAGGSIPNKGASDLTASGKTVTVPAGYYHDQATKDVATGSAETPATTKQQSKPSISIGTDGKITASVEATSVDVTPNVSAGYVSSGTAGTITMSANSNTKQMTTQAAAEWTPQATKRVGVIEAGTYCTGAQDIGAIPNQTAGGIVTLDSITTFAERNESVWLTSKFKVQVTLYTGG